MVGMVFVLGCAPNFVHVANQIPCSALGGKSAGNCQVLVRDVKAIEAVEQDELIALREKERLPLLPGRFARSGRDGLHHDNPRSIALPISTLQDVQFGALDIDL
jgi:hypothetical protein